jgi:hypothetical protein
LHQLKETHSNQDRILISKKPLKDQALLLKKILLLILYSFISSNLSPRPIPQNRYFHLLYHYLTIKLNRHNSNPLFKDAESTSEKDLILMTLFLPQIIILDPHSPNLRIILENHEKKRAQPLKLP